MHGWGVGVASALTAVESGAFGGQYVECMGA